MDDFWEWTDMSAIQQMLFAGRAPITVSGTVYGSGSLAIPAGVTLVSLTGQGGSGVAGTAATYATVQLQTPHSATHPTSLTATTPGVITGSSFAAPGSFPDLRGVLPTGTYTFSQFFSNWANFGGGIVGVIQYRYWSTDGETEITVSYYSYSNGTNAISPTTGPSTTATLNGVTNTWNGGYGGAGTPSSQPLSSTGAGQTLTYSVGSGGYLAYSYTY